MLFLLVLVVADVSVDGDDFLVSDRQKRLRATRRRFRRQTSNVDDWMVNWNNDVIIYVLISVLHTYVVVTAMLLFVQWLLVHDSSRLLYFFNLTLILSSFYELFCILVCH